MAKPSYDPHERVFKTQFHLNMLTSMEEQFGHTLMGAIANSDEIDIFETSVVKDAVDFKWAAFAMASHRMNAFMHIVQVILQQVYIANVYLR